MKTLISASLIIQSGIMLIAMSDIAWAGFFTMGNALIVGLMAALMKWMEYKAKEREKERDIALALALKAADEKINTVAGHVTEIKVATNHMKDAVVEAVKKAALLEGADTERKKAAEIKEAVTEATRAEPALVSPLATTVSQNISATKETVEVIEEDVKDVKNEVLKDVVVAAVQQGIQDAKESK